MINEVLRLLRVFNDMKATELAKDLELSASYISELESGKKQPSMDVIQKYANRFKTTPSTILRMAEGLEKEPSNWKAKLAGVFTKFLLEIEAESK
jgi:transcriptional regulator with XRE-family HTH domain